MSRDIDRLVAEKVMDGAWGGDFCCPRCGNQEFGSGENKDGSRYRVCQGDNGCYWKGDAADAPPPYSTDPAAAWEVVERMLSLGWFWEGNSHGGLGNGTDLVCIFEKELDEDGIAAKRGAAGAPSWPLAVCRAALACFGVEAKP